MGFSQKNLRLNDASKLGDAAILKVLIKKIGQVLIKM